MNWLQALMRSLALVPYVVAGIEHLHGEMPGATKKEMAMDALQLASGIAGVVAPQQQNAINAATALASSTIDGVVSTLNAAGVLKKP